MIRVVQWSILLVASFALVGCIGRGKLELVPQDQREERLWLIAVAGIVVVGLLTYFLWKNGINGRWR